MIRFYRLRLSGYMGLACVLLMLQAPGAFAQTLPGSPAPVAAPQGLLPLGGNVQPVPAAAPAAEPAPAYESVAIKSIMMSSEAVESVRIASAIYSKYSSGREKELTPEEQAFMNQISGLAGGLTKTKHETKQYMYPQYFLEALAYHSRTDWEVHLSGRKIDQTTPQDKVSMKVVGVDKDAIVLEWKPVQLDKFIELQPKQPVSNVEVDKTRGVVLITLRPHQTFTSYAMRVVEGKVKPKIIAAQDGEFPDGIEVGSAAPVAGRAPGGPPGLQRAALEIVQAMMPMTATIRDWAA